MVHIALSDKTYLSLGLLSPLKQNGIIGVCLFVLFDSLHPSQQFFSYVGTGLPGLNQY